LEERGFTIEGATRYQVEEEIRPEKFGTKLEETTEKEYKDLQKVFSTSTELLGQRIGDLNSTIYKFSQEGIKVSNITEINKK
jgi:hypothetical protein